MSQTSIRTRSVIFNTSRQDAFRGDTVIIDVSGTILETDVVKCQMRKFPDSEEFFTLQVIGNKVIIPINITSTLVGEYVLDVELTHLNQIVETIQKNIINFIPDITRNSGTEIIP